MMSDSIIHKIHKGLIVSCQGEPASPFNEPEYLALFAKAAEKGGACAIRAEGMDNIECIKNITRLPLIGLIKSSFEDGSVKITGRFKEVDALASKQCEIIAIDGTFRKREGITGPEFIFKVKKQFDGLILADIARQEEALECFDAGADLVSTTLSGYTPDTYEKCEEGPDFKLLESLVHVKIPVVAEGRYSTPGLAKLAIQKGAWAVVVGSAITRPVSITKWFYDAIQ